jgi:hypothetical protein
MQMRIHFADESHDSFSDKHSKSKDQVDRITAGGARRDRTDDLLLAKQALSQLSYGPALRYPSKGGNGGPGKI